ncbi:MAG: arylformamidase [Sphingobium sp.]|nr:arylformamidase [Sphingobium sp.]MBP9158110.1 arylformamidase [Sphingobium sp.]
MRIWDISQLLRPETPVWPGEPPFEVTQVATIDDVCPVNVGIMRTSLHAGTHADSPYHYNPEGLASADCDLTPYLGHCVVIDVRHAEKCVHETDIDWAALVGAQRVLFRTYERFPAEAWNSSFTAIAPEVIARLGALGVCLIGTDAPSIDPEQSKTLDAHQQVQAADMRILEGLVLDDVPPGDYELIALPLKISGGDASPVRAILREI